MDFSIDLTLLFPALLAIFFILKSEETPMQIIGYHILRKPFPWLVLAVLLLLLLLFTSIKLRLRANPPISGRIGEFSVVLALSILALFTLPPSLFWMAYLFLIILSPCDSRLRSALFYIFFNRLPEVLRSLPAIFISCVVNQNQEDLEAASPPSQEIEMDQVQENHIQNGYSLELSYAS